MIINGKKKDELVELDEGVMEQVAGGYILPGSGENSPEFIPDTIIDDKTLAVIGQTASAEAAANMARTLGVSTERITWVEYENMKVRFGKTE